MNKNLSISFLVVILNILWCSNFYAEDDQIEKIHVKTEDGKQLQINSNGTFTEPAIKEKTMAKTLNKNEQVLLIPDGTWIYLLDLQTKDAGNLKQLGLALKDYADANNGKLPDDLGVLLDWSIETNGQDISEFLICPTSNTKRPKNGDDVRKGNCDYVYLGKGKIMTDLTEDDPLIITDPKKLFHKLEMVCYGDTHVMSRYPISKNIKELLDK